MSNVFCVIMAGGVGSRFWPLSREDKPKQFIDLFGTGKSFLRQTYERFAPMVKDENFIVVTSERYKDLVLEQIPEIKPKQVLCEPVRRNTAPCIAYAAYRIGAMDKDATMIVTPSDHLVTNNQKFETIIKSTIESVEGNDSLMTIGLKPSRPETAYGYIQVDSMDIKEGDIFKVKTFTEKPDLELAKVFVECGEFFWNSGIFVWSVEAIKKALKANIPDVNNLFMRGEGVYNTDKEQVYVNSVFSRCENISIDYGVMEKAENVNMICADFGWSDMGSWNSHYEHTEHDENGNSKSNTMLYDCKDCVIKAPDNKLVVALGLENYIIVDSEDVVMVIPREKEQEIRNYVDDIRAKGGEEYL